MKTEREQSPIRKQGKSLTKARKQQKENIETTENMKTTINKLTAAVIFAFILLAGNVKAEGNDATASKLENIKETSLQMENWMTDSHIWNVKAADTFSVEAEAGLEMENWMTNDSTWEVNPSQLNETETGLQLEDWMTNDKIWNI